MRILSGSLGAFVGIIIGLMATLLISTLLMGGDVGFGVLAGIYLAPWVSVISAILGVIAGLGVLRYRRSEKWTDSTPRRKTVLRISLVLGPVVLVVAMVWGLVKMGNPPSDSAMLAHFRHHQGALEEVIRMTQADKRLERVDYNWTEPDDPKKVGVSPMQIAEYRRLLDSAGVHRGFEHWDGTNEVDFLYWGQGSAISSDTDKGFAYLLKPPAQTLPSLDGCGQDEKNGVLAYRHITGYWYLYYKYLPG